jgi:ketose-bisphosphate aldolase
MIIPYTDLLAQAQAGGYAVIYFEAWDVYSLEAVLEAAEGENAPVILGFGGAMMDSAWVDSGGLDRLGALGLATARAARVPVSLLLNEVKTFPQVVRGIQAGFNAVMLDSSNLPHAEHVRLTQKVVEIAHAVNVGVEAELGVLPDASGEIGDDLGTPTDPDLAADFVAETGIDALSVSVGNVHIMTDGQATIDLDLLAKIHQRVPIPLVLHGGTGFPEAVTIQAIPFGVAKVNIGTALKQAFLEGVRDSIYALPPGFKIQQVMGSRKETDILQQGKNRMCQEVACRIRLWRPG